MSAIPTHTTFPESVHAAWILFQDHFKTILLTVVFVLLPVNVLVDVTTLRNLDWEYVLRQPLERWDPMIFVNFGFILLASLLSLWVTSAVIVTTQRALSHQTTSVSEALGLGLRFWPKVLVTSFLHGLLVLGGVLAFFLPGIIFAFLFFFATQSVILAKRWGFRALVYSSKLVVRHPGVVFLRVIGVWLLVGIPAFAVLSSSAQTDVYGIPAIGSTLVDVILLFATVYFTTLFLELEQRLMESWKSIFFIFALPSFWPLPFWPTKCVNENLRP